MNSVVEQDDSDVYLSSHSISFVLFISEQSLRNNIDDEIRCLRNRIHHLLDEKKMKCDFMLGISGTATSKVICLSLVWTRSFCCPIFHWNSTRVMFSKILEVQNLIKALLALAYIYLALLLSDSKFNKRGF